MRNSTQQQVRNSVVNAMGDLLNCQADANIESAYHRMWGGLVAAMYCDAIGTKRFSRMIDTARAVKETRLARQ